MKVNVMEHQPRTEITLANESIGILINITEEGVAIDIDIRGTAACFMLDNATATNLSHEISNAIDNWRL